MQNNEPTKIDIEAKVKAAIRERQLVMKPRWRFLLEKVSFETAFLAMLLVSTISVSFVYLYSRSNDLGRLLEFGPAGVWMIIQHFPFELILLLGLAILVLNIIGRHLEVSYKVKPVYWYGSIGFAILATCSIMELAGMHQALDRYEHESEMPMLKPYFAYRLHNLNNKTLDGIIEVKDGGVMVFTGWNGHRPSSTVIRLENNIKGPSVRELRSGDRVRVIGEWREERFAPCCIYRH